MCKRMPCIGTPQDILNLANNGYSQNLAATMWAVGANDLGWPVIPMVQIEQLPDGGCPFFIDNLCALHDIGLKPTEGRLASCKNRLIFGKLPVPHTIGAMWADQSHLQTIMLTFKAINHTNNKEK